MSLENLTLAHFRHFSSLFTLSHLYICREPSTNHLLFMQNKPNFRKAQMNANVFSTMNYENKYNWTIGQNKPNSNPNKANCRKAQMNVNLTLTKGYRKKDDFLVRINKPNFRNGQNERKLTYNKGLQKKRCFRSPKNKPNTNPIKAKFRTLFPLTARPVRKKTLSSNGARDYNGIFNLMSYFQRTPIERGWKWIRTI